MGLAHCGTVFSMSVVVGAAVPTTVCRWGLCSRCPGVGKCLRGILIIALLVARWPYVVPRPPQSAIIAVTNVQN